MDKIYKYIEQAIVWTLLFLLVIVIVVSTGELALLIFRELVATFQSGSDGLDINHLIKVFGFFLNVLIGLEFIETVKLYRKEHVFHGEAILLVGIIAITRKVIVLDYTKESPMMIFAIAALIVAVSAGYFLVRKK